MPNDWWGLPQELRKGIWKLGVYTLVKGSFAYLIYFSEDPVRPGLPRTWTCKVSYSAVGTEKVQTTWRRRLPIAL